MPLTGNTVSLVGPPRVAPSERWPSPCEPGFGCVIKSGNTDYPLQENQPYLHNTGTFEIKLSLDGVDRYNTNPRPTYTIEVDEGKAGSDPRKGIDGKNKVYVLEFKLNQAVLSVTEE